MNRELLLFILKKIKKNFFFVIILFSNNIIGQGAVIPLDVNSNKDLIKIFDGYGNSYEKTDVLVDIKKEKTNSRTSFPTCSSGYFTLHFTDGSGMELEFDPIHVERRSVVCQVFNDLSNMINSPLTTSGNKVNIWVRDITQVIGYNSNMLGVASSFYSLPNSPTVIQGGIADNEIWKTINSGVDSYTNVVSPLLASDSSASFYHGMVAVNFTDITNWHMDLSTNAPISFQDLYTLVLHEVTHALGFSSLIDQDGISKFGADYNYYNRYDTLLKDSNGTPLITSFGCSSMYDYTFTANTDVLHPSCASSPPVNNSGNILDSTNCSTAITFGSNNIPVYNPDCYESGSSLSHFEDQCYVDTNTGSPYGNNLYFVMSNANGSGVTKRNLTVEETQVLCDIGYTMNNIAGTTCSGVSVSGVNDGFNGSTFAFTGNIGDPIDLNTVTGGILLNDINTTGFECLEDVYNNSSIIPVTSGTAITTGVTFTSSVPGLYLLRYVPTNGSDKGNITYIYIYLNVDNSCGIPTACDLVINGDFEQNSGFPDGSGQTYKICNLVTPSLSSPEFYHASSTNINYSVPSNTWGNEPDFIPGNNGYIGIYANTSIATNRIATETIRLQLKEPLAPNTTYNISFNTSLADRVVNNNWGSKRLKFQAYLTTNPNDHLGQDTPSTVFDSPIFSETSNGWDTNVIQIQTGNVAGQEYLFIGAINNASELDVGCASANSTLCRTHYYYVDNVSLKRVDTNSFNLPEDICFNNTLDDLSLYLTPVNPGGQFTGNGISAGAFDSSIAGLGTHTITYTYTNNLGCEIILTDTIDVINTVPTDATFTTTTSLSDCLAYTFQANNIYETHEWDFDNDGVMDVSGAGDDLANTNPSYTFTIAGTFTITHTVSNACGSITYQEDIIINCPTTCTGTSTWDGTSWDNGAPDIDTEVILNGHYNTQTNGSFSACSLIVNTGFNLQIEALDYVEVKNNTTVFGDLLVKHTGSFVQNEDSGFFQLQGSGNATVEKMTAMSSVNTEISYISSPTTSTTILELLQNNLLFNGYRYWFNTINFKDSCAETFNNNVCVEGASDGIDDDGNDWIYAENTFVMQPGIGIVVRPNASTSIPLTFTGELNNGVISVPITRNDEDEILVSTGALNVRDDNPIYVGNPYASAISVDAFLAENYIGYNANGIMDGVVLIWSHFTPPSGTTNGNQPLNFDFGDYAMINLTGAIAGGEVVGLSGIVPNRFIPSGQGFFLHYSNAAPSPNGNIIFNNSMRVTGSNEQFFRNSNTADNKLKLNLSTATGVHGEILLGYVEGATNNYDGNAYDAEEHTPVGQNAIIYFNITDTDKKFVIQGKAPEDLNNDEVISVGFFNSIMESESLEFKININDFQGEFFDNQNIYIDDKLLGICHNLSESDYSFTSAIGEFNDRFEVRFNGCETLSTTENELVKIQVFPNPTTGIVNVKSKASINSLELFNNLGQLVLSKKGVNSLNLSSFSEGLYFLKIEDVTGNIKNVRILKQGNL